jgi:hypothetical protein
MCSWYRDYLIKQRDNFTFAIFFSEAMEWLFVIHVTSGKDDDHDHCGGDLKKNPKSAFIR